MPEQEEGVVGQQTACSQQGTQSVERVGHQRVVEGGRGEGGEPVGRRGEAEADRLLLTRFDDWGGACLPRWGSGSVLLSQVFCSGLLLYQGIGVEYGGKGGWLGEGWRSKRRRPGEGGRN